MGDRLKTWRGQLERAARDDGEGGVDLREHRVDVDASMARRVPGKPAGGLLQLPLAADSVAAL